VGKRALIISGGGSKGAYAGGIAEFLIEGMGVRYDIFAGTSTGGLLVPMLAAGEIARIRKVYTSVTQDDIFDVSPFVVRRKNGAFKVRINHLAVLGQFIRRRPTFGESNNLRELIGRTFTVDIYNRLLQQHNYVIVTVANLSRNIVEYKYLRDCSYEDFCDWIWLSSNLVPFMTLHTKNGDEYADGGFGNLVPVQEAINLGATDIDVIILHPRDYTLRYPRSLNAFNVLVRGFGFMLHQIRQDDIKIGLAESRYSGLKVNLIHTPEQLIDNSMIFDPESMTKWWKDGYAYAKRIFTESPDPAIVNKE
jgi:predicted patatin/cPLA2 family phospholipase